MADTNTTGGATATKTEEAEAPKALTTKEQIAASREFQAKEAEKAREPAQIAAAKQGNLEASGTFIEDGAKKAIDVNHPAVDNNPREGTTVRQNAVDFNDPNLDPQEAVRASLGLS